MASDLITRFEDFDVSGTTYGAPRVNARGGKSVKILDSKKSTLYLSTPLMLTWGINKMVDEDTGRVSYSLSLQFPGEGYSNESTQMFYEKMRDLESKILDDAVTNSSAWLNKNKMSREVAEALFTPLLKYPKDKATGEPDYDRSPSLRVKIGYWEGKFNTELYNLDGTTIFNSSTDLGATAFESLIPKTSHVACILQCNGLWFAGGKFGVTWKLTQAAVRRPVRIQGSCFISLSSDDRAQVDSISRREAEEAASAEVAEELEETAQLVEDSDAEEEAAPAPAPAPKPKKKRKVVRKKKATADA
jgi:hypothetical protein